MARLKAHYITGTFAKMKDINRDDLIPVPLSLSVSLPLWVERDHLDTLVSVLPAQNSIRAWMDALDTGYRAFLDSGLFI